MRRWNLTQQDPLALRLAADVRLGATDYADDQIWELTLTAGEPPTLALRTTYGLRARDMRLFPAFREGDAVVIDPSTFAAPPAVNFFTVNLIQVSFSPLAGIHVVADYWASGSHSVAGQFAITNQRSVACSIQFLLCAVLRPLEGGSVMNHVKKEAAQFLQGATGNLKPTVYMRDGVTDDVGSWAALSQSFELAPNETQIIKWAQAARPSAETSLDVCKGLIEQDWSDEIKKIESLAADIPEIETGDPEWDAAFAFAYKVALQSYVGPTQHLPYPSFIFTRTPNKGYSARGDGGDHNWQWDGQVATEAYVNLPQIVQCAPELAKGIIRNYLAVQEPNGFIDWKPGLAAQRNKALCIPLLATLAWIIYEYTEDRDFIDEVYERLKKFVMIWFSSKYDRDNDGVPEWSHTIQSAFDDCPSFVRWQKWGQAADITLSESPDLASYLYRECQSLIQMAKLLGRENDEPPLQAHAEMIRITVDQMWRDHTASYHYIDLETHESPIGYELWRKESNASDVGAKSETSHSVEIHRKFVPSARVLVKVIGERDAAPSQVQVIIHGRGRRGRHRVETIPARRMTWYWGLGSVTSDKLYAEIDRIEVSGVPQGCEVIIGTVDYTRQDQTLLLPIWAGLPKGDRLETLVRRTITDPARYWRDYGIPNCSALDPVYKANNRDGSGGVWMMWNTMIGEGLADGGFTVEAAQLIEKIMRAMIFTLKEEKAFREAYNSDQLEGLGERDYLWGVAPVHLFLRTLGVRIISEKKVWLRGRNPFPFPVTVKWNGVTVTKSEKTTVIKFASGFERVVSEEREMMIEDQTAQTTNGVAQTIVVEPTLAGVQVGRGELSGIL